MCFDVVWAISNFSKYVGGVSYSVEGEIVGRSGGRVLRRNGDRIHAAEVAIEADLMGTSDKRPK